VRESAPPNYLSTVVNRKSRDGLVTGNLCDHKDITSIFLCNRENYEIIIICLESDKVPSVVAEI
jgi:hypothetical protein